MHELVLAQWGKRFHRNIWKARDGDEELSNIKKLLYLGAQQETHYVFLHHMGNKITWQLHQYLIFYLSFISKIRDFTDISKNRDFTFHCAFPCSHLHFHPPLFLSKLLLLDPNPNSSAQKALWTLELKLYPTSLIHPVSLPPQPFSSCGHYPLSSHYPTPPSDKPTSSNLFCVLLGELLLIFCHLSKRDLQLLDTAFHTKDWFLGESNTTEPGRQMR